MIRPLTLYVMQTAHTDIGYTHPQEVIGQMYLDFYDRVLDFCLQTEHEPEEHRFKWTCETFWQVQQYVTHRPEREEEFLRYVRSGQIEITAAYLHFTDVIDADAYRRSLELAVTYCRQHALPLQTAIHSDINGWPWATADILAELGIPYFCSHINLDSATNPLGKRGSVLYQWKRFMLKDALKEDTPFRIPQMFWWQGPNGKRVLHWLSEHYHLGNALGLSGIKEFGGDKSTYYTETDRMTADELYERAQIELPLYIEQLQAAGYPYDTLLVNTAGFFVDNSPPDDRWCRIIARWNREHSDIRIRTTTVSEWFRDFQSRYPETEQDRYPVYQVAWPDYWAHGLGSDTASIVIARRTQRRRMNVEALVTQSQSKKANALFQQALEQERLALEHTFGAWSTTGRPASPLNTFQQIYKELMFHHADLYLTEAAARSLHELSPDWSAVQRLHVGTHTSGTGTHTLHFSTEDFQFDSYHQSLRSQDGTLYPFQLEDAAVARYVATPLLTEPHAITSLTLVEYQGTQPALSQGEQSLRLETEAWKLEIDPATGSLVHMYEQATQREWVDREQEYGFGQLIHERVIHPRGRAAVNTEASLIALDVAREKLLQSMPQGPVFERTVLPTTSQPALMRGPVFDEVSIRSAEPTIGQLQTSWRLYHVLPLVELVLTWEKVWSDLPEAAYVAFPFASRQERLLLETSGGFFQPGSHEAGGQLPGTCSTYYTIQRAASLQSLNGQGLYWLPLDAPLVMPNAINFNNWETKEWQWNGFLASMPVNNYWHTNFPISQRGHLRLRYRFLSQHGFDNREQALQAAMPVEALGWR